MTKSLTNIAGLVFATEFPIDKIGYSNTVNFSQSSTGTDVTHSIPNPLGYKCFITMSWSIDNVNFYPPEAPVNPNNPYSCNASVDAANINFYIYNNNGSTLTFYFQYALDTIN